MLRRLTIVLWASVALGACETEPAHSPLNELMVAEDGRGATEDDLRTLRNAAGASETTLRRAAARALGRLERADLLPDILPLLEDPEAGVRAVAATAVGQALSRGAGAAGFEILRRRMSTDPDAVAAGAAATSIGRLGYTAESEINAAQSALSSFASGALAALAASDEAGLGGDDPITRLHGALRGLEALFRLRPDHAAAPELEALLTELSSLGRDDAANTARGQVRLLAVAALVNAGAPLSDDLLFALQRDPRVGVRRLAAGVIGASRDYGSLLLARALQDSEARVRYGLLAALSRRAPERGACSRLLAGLRDQVATIRLLTIDALPGCDGATATLRRIVADVADSDTATWHEPAHALATLASTDPTEARSPAEGASVHPIWQVRMYAARAAATAGWVDLLRVLAADENANVAAAAVAGLSAHASRDGDDLYLEALASDDGQLLMAAAAALGNRSSADESPAGDSSAGRATATQHLLETLERVTGFERQTSRDPRRALLATIGIVGEPTNAGAVVPYLRDFDAVVASTAADILQRWTGQRPTIDPQSLPPAPFPTAEELDEIDNSRAVVRMQTGGEIVLRLLPLEAPGNTARFVRLARQGYLDGLTFHRVVPNFVIQGGSPGANEYAGDGPYTRDEITARSHLRGTVGISTRGRDTGDAQIFINLIDNLRLDFNYTIIGEVIAGMDVVDGILEGAIIDSVRVERRR